MTDDAPALWLWCDVETSGLLDSRPVVLEAAWMFTDSALTQLTPLRQRLTAIHCIPTLWSRLTSWLRTGSLRDWPSELMSNAVLMMHVRSGLVTDWESAEKIRDVQDLDMAIHEDHLAALHQLDPDGEREVLMHLAGAGVAQFEARLLPMIGSDLPPWLHYRCADSSVAAMTLGVPKTTQAPPGDYLSVDIQSEDAERALNHPHRAAADVRAAWHQVQDLRARLAVEGSPA